MYDVAHSIGATFVTLKIMHRQNVKYTILQVLTFAYLFSLLNSFNSRIFVCFLSFVLASASKLILQSKNNCLYVLSFLCVLI